jgi:hypothetical protein
MELLRELFEIMNEGKKKDKITLDPLKPRNKHLNDVLRARKSGAHYDARNDYNRAKEKNKIRKGDE